MLASLFLHFFGVRSVDIKDNEKCSLEWPHASLKRSSKTVKNASPIDMYTVQPLWPHFGGVIRDIDLSKAELNEELVAKIKDDIVKYRVILFKDQLNFTAAQQVKLSSALGTVESTFYKHPKSPHPDVFRVSNDENEGCTGVGRTGWHVDGTFQNSPFKYQTMHFISVIKGGNTGFIPLKELYERQTEKKRKEWDRLWMMTGRNQKVHPLVYQHPYRNDTTMLFHCGEPFCVGWVQDEDKEPSHERKPENMLQPKGIRNEISAACEQALKDGIGFEFEWEAGDFSINDNIGLAHYAYPATQNDREKSGLRILHRTTIAGEITPEKADGRKSFRI